MRRPLAGLLLLAAVAAVPTVAAAPGVRLSGPRTAVAGRTWTAAVVGAAQRPVVVARRAGVARRAAVSAAGQRRWRVRLAFPSAGRWTLIATVGRKRHALGAVTVRPAPAPPLRLVDALDVVVEAGGTVVIADAGDRVLRGDPSTGRLSLIARLPLPIEVALAPSGEIAVASENRIAALGPIRTVADAAEPRGLAFDPAGNVYVSEVNGGVRRIEHGGASTTVAADVNQPHGLAVAADGSVFVADTGNGRIRRVAPDGTATTVASGLATPVDVALAPDGTLYVAEFGANRIARVGPSGVVTTLASLPGTSGVAVGPDGTVWATQRSGPVSRIDPATGAVTAVFR